MKAEVRPYATETTKIIIRGRADVRRCDVAMDDCITGNVIVRNLVVVMV